jgi:hypothetical protein
MMADSPHPWPPRSARGDLIRGFEDELHDAVPQAKRQWASVPAVSLRYSRGPSSCGMRPAVPIKAGRVAVLAKEWPLNRKPEGHNHEVFSS